MVWGDGGGFGQRRRKRAVGVMGVSPHVALGQGQPGQGRGGEGEVLEGRVVEDARLVVLGKEREAVARMVGVGAGGSGRRR